MKRRKYLLLLAAFGGLASVLPLAACSDGEETAQPAKAPAGPRLILAASNTTDWQDVSAEIATVDQAQIIARIPGILTSLSVREGDVVGKGQVIGRIVDNQLGFQAQAYGAQAAQAHAELERVRYLYKNGVYAKARLDQAEAAAGSAGAQHAAASALAGQGSLVAPATGRVLRADVPVGSPVAPGMTIAVLTAGPAIVRAEIPESLANAAHAGTHVIAKGIGDGPIVKLYPSVNAGTITADVAMPGIDNRLVGRRVAAQLDAGTRKALMIPAAYVTSRYGMDYVTILAKDGSAAQVPVQIASSSEPGKVEILSGAVAGDTLIGPPGRGSGK